MLPDVKQEHVEFILKYAKKDGLYSLVSRLEMNEEKTKLEADLQPDLINAFNIAFPNTNMSELDATIEWVLLTSVAKRKEKEKNG